MQIYYILSKTDNRQALSHTHRHRHMAQQFGRFSFWYRPVSQERALSPIYTIPFDFVPYSFIRTSLVSSADDGSDAAAELVHCVPLAQNSYNPNHAIYLNFLDFMILCFGFFSAVLCYSHATCEFVHMLSLQRIYLIIFQFYS